MTFFWGGVLRNTAKIILGNCVLILAIYFGNMHQANMVRVDVTLTMVGLILALPLINGLVGIIMTWRINSLTSPADAGEKKRFKVMATAFLVTAVLVVPLILGIWALLMVTH